jgi:hypothetical protein
VKTTNNYYGTGKKMKGRRIMKIDEDSILCPRIFLPAFCRPFNAYAVSSNGIFEMARFERKYKFVLLCCNRPEILVFKTEFVYTKEDDTSYD